MPYLLKTTALTVSLLAAIGCASPKQPALPTSDASYPPPSPPPVLSAKPEPFVVTEEVVQRALQSAVDAYETMRKTAGRSVNGVPWPKLHSINGLVDARLIKYIPPAPQGKRWHLNTFKQRVELKDELP
ncbi:MAG: hypothetical protein ACI9VS_002727 [Candidatus Binatia bacterium]|jgi:hypothetical protein